MIKCENGFAMKHPYLVRHCQSESQRPDTPLTLLLKHFDDRFGFEDWKKLTNPDVFLVKLEGRLPRSVERLWR